MKRDFSGIYGDKRVLVTGHTGFKGSWLCLWLHALGAKVAGFSIDVPTDSSHFESCGLADILEDLRGDICDYPALVSRFESFRPEIIFHLAAQPLVRRAFMQPRETFETNVMGTVNVLEAARLCASVRTVMVATSDKAYRNVGWDWPYRETDALGGHEPYSGSKACAELVVEVYRQQRFQANAKPPSAISIASARAGNVIGGGDWAQDRLVPDVVRAIAAGTDVTIRYPEAVRPWQHVLDCLAGYLQLAARQTAEPGRFEDAWNFGPADAEQLPVSELVTRMLAGWQGHQTRLVVEPGLPGKEAQILRVDSSKAIRQLGWRPVWSTAAALEATIAWYRGTIDAARDRARQTSLGQIEAYSSAATAIGAGWAAR